MDPRSRHRVGAQRRQRRSAARGRLAGAFGAVLLLALVLAPARAGAQKAGEWQIGISPAYAFIVLADRAEPSGGGAMLHLHYGLTDTFALRLTGGWSGHDVASTEEYEGGLFQVISGSGGLSYAFDLGGDVRAGLEGGLGVLHQRFGELRSTSLALNLGVALDYRALPWLAVGFAFHYHAYLANPSEYPVYFDIGPRVGLCF